MRQCRIFLMPDGEEWPTTLWEKLKSISHFWWAGGNGAALVVNEYSADIVRTELGACIESTVDTANSSWMNLHDDLREQRRLLREFGKPHPPMPPAEPSSESVAGGCATLFGSVPAPDDTFQQ